MALGPVAVRTFGRSILMAWRFFSMFRQSRDEEGHEAVFSLKQGVVAERRASVAFKDLAAIGEENLKTLEEIIDVAQQFEERDKVVAAAAKAYREGLASLIATPLSHYPADAEARREVLQSPSNGSTASQPSSINGPSESSRAALPDQSHPHQPDDQGQPPRRGRGRPPGSRNKPKPRPPAGREE